MKRNLMLVLVITILGVMAIAPVLAQEATQEAGTISTGSVNCDADLMLNLYIAQRFFGYDAVQSQLRAGGVAGAVDPTLYNAGQFGTLSNTVRAMQDPNTGMMTNSGWTQDQLNALSGMLAMDDATFEEQWNTTFGGDPNMANMTPLTSATVAGEAPECTALRTSLYRFWRAIALQDFTTGMTGTFSNNMGSTGAQGGTGDMGAATPEATASG
ncbi:MAG: hypothetical protein HZC41_12805 [Chloroflexi bacterium]|nr:hypothetical protein [Chloroflexota bacterium]